jgi:hypothetical protein
MLSGRVLDLLDPRPGDIEIEDIAQGLSRVARWNGQTRGAQAFSVAQHSCVVADLFERLRPRATAGERMAALLHDAPEYVIGDLISPFKAVIGRQYRQLEKRLLAAIHLRFAVPALPVPARRDIKQADAIAAWHEATALAGFSSDEAATWFADGRAFPLPDGALTPLDPAGAAALFLGRFRRIAEAGT